MRPPSVPLPAAALPAALLLAAVLAWTCAPARAEAPTPPDAPLAAGAETEIACVPPEGAGAAGPLHYRLYLPDDYRADGATRYPAMFVAAPGGQARMAPFGSVLTDGRWVVAMLEESRNGSPLWLANFLCAHDDLVRRVRVIEGMKFCTGLSGAAKVCSVFPSLRPGFAGMFLHAAGPWRGDVFSGPAGSRLVVFATFGVEDPNLHHAFRIRRFLPPGVARLVEVWDGGHQWAPASLFGWGLDWMLARRLDALFHEDIKDEISESYDWYFEYEHRKFQTADQAGERIQAGRALVALGRRMGDGLSGSRKDRLAATARALAEAEAAAPGAGEALESLLAVLAEDSGGEGRNLETVAAAYDAVAARYPDTWAGALAARRAQSVRWERLVVR